LKQQLREMQKVEAEKEVLPAADQQPKPQAMEEPKKKEEEHEQKAEEKEEGETKLEEELKAEAESKTEEEGKKEEQKDPPSPPMRAAPEHLKQQLREMQKVEAEKEVLPAAEEQATTKEEEEEEPTTNAKEAEAAPKLEEQGKIEAQAWLNPAEESKAEQEKPTETGEVAISAGEAEVQSEVEKPRPEEPEKPKEPGLIWATEMPEAEEMPASMAGAEEADAAKDAASAKTLRWDAQTVGEEKARTEAWSALWSRYSTSQTWPVPELEMVTKWFRAEKLIILRKEPKMDGARSGDAVVRSRHWFEVDAVQQHNGIQMLRLKDGSGWVPNVEQRGEPLCVELGSEPKDESRERNWEAREARRSRPSRDWDRKEWEQKDWEQKWEQKEWEQKDWEQKDWEQQGWDWKNEDKRDKSWEWKWQ